MIKIQEWTVLLLCSAGIVECVSSVEPLYIMVIKLQIKMNEIDSLPRDDRDFDVYIENVIIFIASCGVYQFVKFCINFR